MRPRGAALEAKNLLLSSQRLMCARPEFVAHDAKVLNLRHDPLGHRPVALLAASPGVALLRAPPHDLALVERFEQDDADA